MMLALVGRRGDTGHRYRMRHAKAMYQQGIACANAGDLMQVWVALDNGDLLKYDSARTRRLTDKIKGGARIDE